MAIFAPGPAVGKISGKVGAVTFLAGAGAPAIRLDGRRTGQPSTAQLEAQRYPRLISTAWHALNPSIRDAWHTAASKINRSNRLGVTSPINGWTLYWQYAALVYDGQAPASLLPPETLDIVVPQYAHLHAISGGPYLLTSWGQPWPDATPTEYLDIQRFRGIAQHTGWNRYSAITKYSKTQPTLDVFGDFDDAGINLISGEPCALGTRWRKSSGIPGPLSWSRATVDSYPWEIDYYRRDNLGPYTESTPGVFLVGPYVPTGGRLLVADPSGSPSQVYTAYTRSGLPVFPAAGTQFSTHLALSISGNRVGVLWGLQGSDDYYFAFFRHDIQVAQLWRRVAGVQTLLDSHASGPVAANEILQMVIDWAPNGDIRVRTYDSTPTLLSTLTATDTTFSAGGVGYYTQAGAAGFGAGYWLDFTLQGPHQN